MTVNKKFTDLHVQMDGRVEDFKTLSEEIETFTKIAESKIQVIKDKLSVEVTKREEKQRQIVAELRVFAEQVPQKESKTQSKVELLSGSIVIKKPQKTLVADKIKLIEWAKANAMHEYLDEKIVESFKWKEMKSDLAIVDDMGENTIINQQTGEILNIDGLTVEIKPEEVVIK